MLSSNYIGIDYGLGQTNIDKETGIRFGVISQNSCRPEAADDIMTHGDDLAFTSAKSDYLAQTIERIDHWFNEHAFVRDGTEDEKRQRFKLLIQERLDNIGSRSLAKHVAKEATEDWGMSSTRDEIVGDAEAAVDNHFGDHYESDGGLNDYRYTQNGYVLTGCLQNDIFVGKSEYYTYAQFCSPCVPGAGNLDTPMPAETGAPRTYCLGHDWFDHDKAPYRLWRVVDGVEIVSQKIESVCPSCKGTGRDTAQRLAEIRQVPVEAVDLSNFEDVDFQTRTFKCLRCEGGGIYWHTDTVEGAVDPNFK